MDGHRFDALVRSLASGTSRRGVLKGFLGLGAGVVAAGTIDEGSAQRRPTPTPKPVSCAPPKVVSGGQCVCPGGTKTCGPDCCPNGQATCCDNACCYGECFGEELCCPSYRQFCAASGECCPEGWRCCPDFGCIPPGGCCEISECAERECHSYECGPNHTCDYTFDCTLDDGCCPDEECFAGWCQENGSCGEPNFDCRIGGVADECCRGQGPCQSDGTCQCAGYCEISGQCCGQHEKCCPEIGCVSFDSCCDITECEPRECHTVICGAEHTCEYTFDCDGDAACCPKPSQPCYGAVCLEDGSCGEPEYDCRGWDEEECCEGAQSCLENGRCGCDCNRDERCCEDELCLAGICREDGTCEHVSDCRAGDQPEACCTELNQTCQNDGTCLCTPWCGGGSWCNRGDGCGGTCDCPFETLWCDTSTNTCQECPYAINWVPCGGEDGQNPACRIVCNTEHELLCFDTRFSSGLTCDDTCETSDDCPPGAQCIVRSACFGNVCQWPCPDDLEVEPPPGP